MGGSKNQKAKGTHNVDRPVAETIYNADTIYLASPEPSAQERAEDLFRRGERSLRDVFYESAVAHLTQCVDLGALGPSATADARFFHALAILGGKRPSMCSGSQITAALKALGPSPHTAHARFLLALVEEDRTNAWMDSPRSPGNLRLMAQQVDRSHAELICRHVPARESRVWRALNEHVEGTV